jgi:transposase
MKASWLFDARKIPDKVMNYIRRIAVRAVEEKHYSPELIADIFGISRSSIYDWLRWYRKNGEDALDTSSAPGAPLIMLPHIDHWLKETILNSTPVDHGYDTVLWTLKILVDLIKKQFDIDVSDSTVALHLHKMRLSCQKPCYRAKQQDPEQVDDFLDHKFPEIQELAENMGADIAFEDEAGVGIMTRSGRTWGEVDSPPEVKASDQRGGYNVLSMITAKGELMYDLEEKTINGKRYIEFLEKVLTDRQRPLIVMTDNSSYHCSKEVNQFAQTHKEQIHLFSFPTHSPELNPAEQIWNDIKYRQLGKQPIKNKPDLNKRLRRVLNSLQEQKEKIKSFFELPNTRYAATQRLNL